MTVASEIKRIKTNISNAYSKAEEKGATLPAEQNSNNLASTIESIQGGGGGGDKVLAQTTEATVTGAEGEKVFLQPVAKKLKPEAYPLVDYMVSGDYLVWNSGFKTRNNHQAWIGPIRAYFGEDTIPYEYTAEGSFTLRKDLPISDSYGSSYPDSEKGISICSNYTIAYNDKTKEITKTTGGIGFAPYTYSSRWYGDYLLIYLQGSTVDDSEGNPYNVVVCKYSEDTETGVKSLPIVHRIYIESLGAITQTSYNGLISETDPIICLPISASTNRTYNFYKIDLENGSFIEYTPIELEATGVSSYYAQSINHFAGNLLVLADSSYKISFDDTGLTVNIEDSISSRKCPYMIRGYKCTKTYLYHDTTASANVYTVENFDDYDTFSYTLYQCPVKNGIVIEDKIYVQGYLHWDNGTKVTPIEDIVWPAAGAESATYPIGWVSEGGVCQKGSLRYVIQDNALIDPQYSRISDRKDQTFFFHNGDVWGALYKSGTSSTVYAWTDSTRISSGATKAVYNFVFDDLVCTSTANTNTNVVKISPEGVATTLTKTISFIEESPEQSMASNYYFNFYRNGNKLYLLSTYKLYVADLDLENNTWTVYYGMSISLGTVPARYGSLTKDSLFYLHKDGYDVPSFSDENVNIMTKESFSYSEEVANELSSMNMSSTKAAIVPFYDNHVLFVGTNRAILCKYTNTPSDMEIVWTYTWDSSTYTSTWINFSQTRQYLTIVHYDGSNYVYQVYVQDESNPYNYIAYKPATFRFSPRTLSGFCTGKQGTDENGRHYVEVSTVLPEESS